MEINITKLTKELQAAGIPIDGLNSDGIIWFKDEATDAQKLLAAEILKNHNPIWYIDQRNGPDGYKSIGDQLDMMYWDKVNGTNNWFNHIQDVKNRFPKQ